MVRNLEGIYDINDDGKKEIVLKAVDKDDVMGQGYRIEIYQLGKVNLFLNRILCYFENIFC
jgi:hypothetical protein